MSNAITISDFIAGEWSQYADYDNRRSLPHIMDGLKITQRKAIYTAVGLPKGDKPIRVSQFAAEAANKTAYHHADASMVTTTVGLAQDFPGTNNFPYLQKHGQFGSRLSKKAAAPRYIHTKLHENWETFFKKEDQEIVEHLYDDGDKIEPKYYIPVVPMILVNGADGVGNGFKSYILSYNLKDVAKACREVSKHGKVKTKLIPYINGWTGNVSKVDKQVVLTGVLKVVNTTKIEITELPPSYDNEKFKKILNELADNGFIKDYENKSTEDNWRWIVAVPRSTSSLTVDDLLVKFKLIEKTTENFVGWGMNDSAPMVFDAPESLVEYWYNERLSLYEKSISHQIDKCKDRIRLAAIKSEFIQWCLKNDFRKLSKAEFILKSSTAIKQLTEELASEFVSIPMYRITVDEVEKLQKDIESQLDELDELERLTPEAMMEKNLKGL